MDGELDSVGDGKRFICRFCKREFSKSQSLGGHMNGHRQERDSESYVKAKELLEQKGGSSYRMGNNQYATPQNYSSIPEGVQGNVNLSSPSQVQSWAQAGYPYSMSTYSNQNVGDVGSTSHSNQNAVGVGATSYLNQQQHAFVQNQGDHTDYQGRETYPFNPNYQITETYQSLPYQRNNNLQTEASLLDNSGISGPPLHMKSCLQIGGPYLATPLGGTQNAVVNGYVAESASEQQQPAFPTSRGSPDLHVKGYGVVSASEQQQPAFLTLQGGNPNLGVNGYAAASACGQKQQLFSVDHSHQPY